MSANNTPGNDLFISRHSLHCFQRKHDGSGKETKDDERAWLFIVDDDLSFLICRRDSLCEGKDAGANFTGV